MANPSASPGSRDLYAQVPQRVREALLLGDLSFVQLGIAVFLCLAADYRTRTYTGTLRTISDALQWERGLDKLGRDLAALRDDNWIDFEVSQGQRKPYVIRLTGLLVEGTSASTSAADPPSRAEVTSAQRKSRERANPDPMPSGELLQLPTRGGSLEVEVNVDRDVDREGDTVCSDDAENASPRALENDDDGQALEGLVAQLDDADRNTLATFRRHFLGQLGADDFDYAAGVLAKRRQGTRLDGEPLDSESSFVFSVLSNQAYQKNWTPKAAHREEGSTR